MCVQGSLVPEMHLMRVPDIVAFLKTCAKLQAQLKPDFVDLLDLRLRQALRIYGASAEEADAVR